MLWTAFPDTLDTSALTLLLSAWRGEKIDQDAGVLSAFNLLGYAYKQGFAVNENVAMASSSEETEAAFAAAIGAPGVAQAGAIPWYILLPVVLTLLQKFLSRK